MVQALTIFPGIQSSLIWQMTGYREKNELKRKRFQVKFVKIVPTRMGFEPTRAEHIGLAVQRLNHSATSSHVLLREHSMSSILSARTEFSLNIISLL